MSNHSNETTASPNFGAFIPVEDTEDSENGDEEDIEEEEDQYNDEESFQGDYNDEEEYANQVDLFEVLSSIPSTNSERYENLTESDILPEEFFKTSYLEAIQYENEDGQEAITKRKKLS